MPEAAEFAGSSLLAVFAHPDDESLACGGLLASCAARGARVTLLCVTKGEDGPGDEQAIELRRRTRAGELEAAARVLGLSEVILLDYPDGELKWLDPARSDRLQVDIAAAIARTSPAVVITFGEDGLYWHPDHIMIHELTTAAVAALGDAAPALYYVTLPPGAIRTIVDTVERDVPDGRAHRLVFGIDDPDAFGAFAAPPTLVVDAGPFAARKLEALRCHRSQLRDEALAVVPEATALRVLGTEHFHRASVGATGDTFLEGLAT